MSSEPGTSFFAKIKDSLQMIMYITAITGTTLAGVIKGCGLMNDDEETKQEAVVEQEQPAEMKAAPKTGVKPKAEAKVTPAAVNESKAEVKNEPEPVKKEPLEHTKQSPIKKASVVVQSSKSDPKAEPAPKPVEPAVKPMTKEEVEVLKKKIEKDKEDLDKKRKAEDPTDSSSNVKDDKRKKIDKEADDFMKQLN